MRIEALECFHEIMKSGSIRQAASNSYMTQQGLSKMVQSLEGELGVRLFQKRGRNVVPTPQALMLDDFAKNVIGDYRELLGRLKASPAEGQSASEMILCITPFVGNGFFDMLRPEMDKSQIGNDDLILREGCIEDILESFQAGAIDFALLNIPEADYAELRPLLNPTALLVSEIVLMVPRSLMGSVSGKTVTPETLAHLPIAYYNDGVLNRLVEKFSESAGVPKPKLLQHSTNISSIHALVNEGRAVTFSDTFSLTVRNGMKNVVPVPLDPPQRFVICFLVDPALDDSSPQWRYVSRFKEMLYDNHGAYLRDSFLSF